MTRIVIALTPDYADWEVALMMAAGRVFLGIGFSVATPGGAAVTSMGGMEARARAAIEALDPSAYDGLVICGGQAWQREAAPDMSATIQAFAEAGKLVAGICAGTLALARAGILNDVGHTSNEPALLETAPSYRGRAHYRDSAAAVLDRQVITAPGTAPVSFAATLFRALGAGGPELDGFMAAFGREHAIA